MTPSIAESFDSIPPNGRFGLSDDAIEQLVLRFTKEAEDDYRSKVEPSVTSRVGKENAISYSAALKCRKWKQSQESKVDANRGSRG